MTKSVRYENYAFRTREQYMTINKFEWSPLDKCYDIPPFDINKTNDLCTDYLDIFIINFGNWSQSLTSEDVSTILNTNTNIYIRCSLS
jgi:hypothetical protein